jgi:L-malate glycosyltransferase
LEGHQLKIAFFTNNPNLGSTARILVSWLDSCRQQNIETVVVCKSSGALPDYLREKKFQVLINDMPIVQRRNPLRSWFQAMRVAYTVADADILHFNEHDIFPFARSLRLFNKRPTVCHVRYKLESGFANWAFSGKRCPDALLWTSYQQMSDSKDAVSGSVPSERQHVVRLGIDTSTFGSDASLRSSYRKSLGIGQDEILIGMPSPMRERKRIEDFIELIKRLSLSNSKVVGLLAGGSIQGEESYCQRIVQSINSSGLGSRLRWLGNLEPIEPFHMACDISVSTSEYETFGNSVCEAMACSKPVVAYAAGSIAEVLGDAGITVSTGDLNGLTQAVEKLAQDQELRSTLGLRARERVKEEFNPRTSFMQLCSIYRQVAQYKFSKTEGLL